MTYTLENRISLLPAKVSMPFRQLLSSGQISEDVVSLVLDAGEITGETTKLIGFAVGFLHLRAQGVPVHDVIRMAKAQKRRINLGWSAKRWKDEHDRLSRAEALNRMAEENFSYDLSMYEKHLPKCFSGYLIRSSRRLGMEGLRQRHCIASYDYRLRNGNCAIAAVLIDKQRWTVELTLTNDPDVPLRIEQIKTRYNGLPAAHTRQKIYEELGIDLKKAAASYPSCAVQSYLYMENLRRILPILREGGINTVTVSFNGGGDSGAVEDIAYEPNQDVKDMPIEHLSTDSYFDEGQWRRSVTPQQSTINEVIDALTYDYLEETGIDWCNDDGGFGELIIDVQQGTVSLEVNVRYTESNTQYDAERDIATGEEI